MIRAFTCDRDMADMTRRSLGVRVLLTRDQLSDLAQALRAILDAGMASRVDPATFFTQLRTAFAAAARGAAQTAPMDRIGNLLGEYLDGLPYHSDIMNISQDDWLAMGGIKQADILNGVEAKLRLYQEYQSQPDLWVESRRRRPSGRGRISGADRSIAVKTTLLTATGVRRELHRGGDQVCRGQSNGWSCGRGTASQRSGPRVRQEHSIRGARPGAAAGRRRCV